MSDELLEVEGLTKHFPVTRGVLGRVVGQVRAVDDVSFHVARGEALGLVGESGCGKTTVGRSILRLIEPSGGRVRFEGTDVTSADADELRKLRRSMQIVFQDPYGSLNPRLRVIDIVGEALEQHGILHGAAVERRVAELLRRVGLSPSWINRYPHEFSGGQRQRIGIARAIALEPKLVVCDEPVSALDVSIQAQVVNLLKELGREFELSYLFIAHDLSVVRHISHRIAVMYLGEIVEITAAKQLFSRPAHPYTRALLSAIPVPDPTRRKRRLILAGDIPSPLNPPSGCRFHTRCPAVFERCQSEPPKLVSVEPGHEVRCFHAYDLPAGDDWYPELDSRIDGAIQKNAQSVAFSAPSAALVPASEPDSAPFAEARLRAQAGAADAAPARPRSKQRAYLLLIGLLLVTLVITRIARNIGRDVEARRELSALASALEAFAKNTGAYPLTLGELGWRLPPIFRGGPALDPWGRAWIYRSASPAKPMELKSLGPDGIPSSDDITRRR